MFSVEMLLLTLEVKGHRNAWE